ALYRLLASRAAALKDQVASKLISLALIIIITLGLGIFIHESRTWGNWPPSATAGEYRAADWINDYASKDAIIVCNWFTGDFIRSLTRRRTCISNYFRPEVRATLEREKGLNTVNGAPLEVLTTTPYLQGLCREGAIKTRPSFTELAPGMVLPI
ncbi:MAG: hypothetical protein ACYSTN_10290, partial [Planctomycetota bacterium]